MPNDQIAPCQCGFLEREANHPDSPIRFDARLNEYHFIHRMSTGQEAMMMIYYCPFCGGKAPKSRRDDLFHRLTQAETRRLLKLTEKFRTLDEVITAFGQPDLDQPTGEVLTIPERDGKPERTESFRVLIYRNLSDTADVHVSVQPTDKVSFAFCGKPIET